MVSSVTPRRAFQTMHALLRAGGVAATMLMTTSCTLRFPSGFAGNIAFVETNLYPDRPFYYMGRKGTRDYFKFDNDGRPMRFSTPAGDIRAVEPFPYTRDRTKWVMMNGKFPLFSK
jgi:hypothetical protein